MKVLRLAPLGAVLLAVVLPIGCGYRLGGLLPPRIKTVKVDIMENLDRRARGFERELHEALVNQFVLQGYRVVAEDADALVRGEIKDSWKTPLSETTINLSRESEVEFILEVFVRDQRTGEYYLPSLTIRSARSFVDVRGETLTTVRPKLAQDLARKVIQRLEEQPPRPAAAAGPVPK